MRKRPRPTRRLLRQEKIRLVSVIYEQPFYRKPFSTHIIHGQPSKLAEYFIYRQFVRLDQFFFLLALQPPSGVVFYSPLVGFSLLAYEVS